MHLIIMHVRYGEYSQSVFAENVGYTPINQYMVDMPAT